MTRIIRYTPIEDSLTVVSDTLIDNQQKFLNFDAMKDNSRETKKFKSPDTLFCKGDTIYLTEFKRCNLFYKEVLNDDEEKKVNSIIKDTAEKLTHSILVHLPNSFSCFKTNTKFKVNYILVLGTLISDPKYRGRTRSVLKLERDQYKKLRKSICKYAHTPYIKDCTIITKEQFKTKYQV